MLVYDEMIFYPSDPLLGWGDATDEILMTWKSISLIKDVEIVVR